MTKYGLPAIMPSNVCPVCGREFYPTPEWRYKLEYMRSKTKTYKTLCSWTCFRKAQKDIPVKQKRGRKKEY